MVEQPIARVEDPAPQEGGHHRGHDPGDERDRAQRRAAAEGLAEDQRPGEPQSDREHARERHVDEGDEEGLLDLRVGENVGEVSQAHPHRFWRAQRVLVERQRQRAQERPQHDDAESAERRQQEGDAEAPLAAFSPPRRAWGETRVAADGGAATSATLTNAHGSLRRVRRGGVQEVGVEEQRVTRLHLGVDRLQLPAGGVEVGQVRPPLDRRAPRARCAPERASPSAPEGSRSRASRGRAR